jgi:glutaredoxin-like YruB-family protein
MPARTTTLGLALVAWTLLTGDARAQVYSWVDQDGTVHYTEEPPPEGRRARKLALPAEEPPPPRASAEQKEAGGAPKAGDGRAGTEAAAKPSAPAARPPAAARPAPSVVLYSTAWCPWCKKAREYFRSRGIAFTEHDIEADAAAMKRKLALDGNQSVPTAVIGDTVVRGFSPARYQAALERR